MRIKNSFITGPPRSGKTTLIKEILRELNKNIRGFFTEEIRKSGERVGFKIITLNGKEGILAHKNFNSRYKLGKYGINLRDLEEIGVKEIEEGLRENCILVIDEVGKMELFSQKFRRVLLEALDSEQKVLGTILFSPHPFCDKIKKRQDTKVFDLSKSTQKEIKEEILKIL